MSSQQTRFTLVLGAGASYDFGLPLGETLKTSITQDLDIKFQLGGAAMTSGSHEIVEALRALVQRSDNQDRDINPHRKAAVHIADSMPYSRSIDDYIERNRNNVLKAECAKLAIGKTILEAERKSSIYGNPLNPNIDPLSSATSSWISSFLGDVTRGLSKVEVAQALQGFSVINFNYDRCFEHFTFHWLRQMYEFDTESAGQIVNKMSIFHPYGKLGPLRFQSHQEYVPYGGEVSTNRLLSMMANIRTYSETVETESGLNDAVERMARTKKIIYLGFGFHRQNMKLLNLPEASQRASLRCFATTLGLPKPTWEICKDRIAQAMKTPSSGLFVEHTDSDCAKFWTEYGETIIS